MKKVIISAGVAIATLLSVTDAQAGATIFGKGGAVKSGSTTIYCPQQASAVCATLSVISPAPFDLVDVYLVSGEVRTAMVVSIEGEFDEEGNIQGSDITFEELR